MFVRMEGSWSRIQYAEGSRSTTPEERSRQPGSIDFPADSVVRLDDETFAAHDAASAVWRVIGRGGAIQNATVQPNAPPLPRLLSRNNGVVPRPGRPDLAVQYNRDQLRLVSLTNLGTDPQGNTFVALELTPGGEEVDVRKHVRRYGPDGRLVAQITHIPLNYDVQPMDEMRVRNGIVYHLMPTEREVQIHVWSTQ